MSILSWWHVWRSNRDIEQFDAGFGSVMTAYYWYEDIECVSYRCHAGVKRSPFEEGVCAALRLLPTEAFHDIPPSAEVKARWAGDSTKLQVGAEVTILATDHSDPSTRKACWIRYWPAERDFPVYRSCDLADLEVIGS